MFTTFSLLYPEGISNDDGLYLNPNTIDDLDIDTLMPFFMSKNQYQNAKDDLLSLLTKDEKVIKYRNDIIEDFIINKEFFNLLIDQQEQLFQLEQSIKLKRAQNDSIGKLALLKEMEMFFDFIDKINISLGSPEIKLNSEGLLLYKDLITKYTNETDIKKIKNEIKNISLSFEIPKSITLGVNLNAQLKPFEAGVVSINSEYYEYSNFIDKLFRMNFNKDSYSCICDFVPLDYKEGNTEGSALQSALTNLYNKIFDKTLKKVANSIQDYITYSSNLLLSIKELIFYLNCVNLIYHMRKKSLPMCKPKVKDKNKRFIKLKGNYNICLAINKDKIVSNDAEFNDNNRIYILTGANGGGKTIYAKSLGVTQILFQLGMFVPAAEAEMSICDNILTHFNAEENFSQGIGRFEVECQTIKKLLNSANEHSLFIFNEAFNSTSYTDACNISENILKALSIVGARGVYVTHLHQLSMEYEKLNENNNVIQKSKIGTLVASSDFELTGIKNYKITNQKSDGKSYSNKIVLKYGLDLESLLNNVQV
jgi:DNA mismatch repair protein MutS